MAILASDAFTAADSTALQTYSSNWTVMQGNIVITSNSFRGNSASGGSMALWNAITWPDNQACQVTIVANLMTGYAGSGPAVRVTDADPEIGNGYYWLGGVSESYFGTNTAGAWSDLGTEIGEANNDIMRVVAEGNQLSLYVNGEFQGTYTNSAFSSGAAGVCTFHNVTTNRSDDWQGESLVSPSLMPRSVNQRSTHILVR